MKFTFLVRFLKYKNNLCVLSLVKFLINNINMNIKSFRLTLEFFR